MNGHTFIVENVTRQIRGGREEWKDGGEVREGGRSMEVLARRVDTV